MSDARTSTEHMGGRWHGRYGTAPCPVCQPEGRKGQGALTLGDGRGGLLAHCKKSHCDFRAILEAVGIMPGEYRAPDPPVIAQREVERRAEAEKRAQQAFGIWWGAQPIEGTAAETYLRGRGITCPLPDTLRFLPECWHGATARRHSAMVARIDGAEGFAVHRTYLRPDGKGKAALEPAKAMLGAVTGGAVRLSEGPGPLVVAEGLETAFSLASGLLRAPVTTWAALSASGMAGLRLPRDPGRLTIAPDGDAPGRKAAHDLAERAHALGWQVSMLDPGDGLDWNDHLRGCAA